ncbi:MAG: transglycosylase SLT domain-containing protein [Mesorhizobium sp.]|nr:transglycosylase SLT domain-containing protein [Mesorhizobium sp.]MBL8577801.1 transglycosylase SLT domain-containing protein [Mesorhizobium sp.]
MPVVRRTTAALTGLALAGLQLITAAPTLADPPGRSLPVTIGRICTLLEREADRNGIPKDFFARLIFKESRFDPGAVSPAGAEGIAQFMPGTAAMRGLDDSFDIEKALPASAKYLGELKDRFGNLGLASAAYNAGEGRVSRWLSSGGFLPLETENYVLDIMGEPADVFAEPSYAGTVQPLHPTVAFAKACRNLPVTMSAVVAMSSIHTKPWGIQVAGNARRNAAIRQWERVKGRFSALLSGHDPVVSRVRSARVPRGIYAVRIGAESRKEADKICDRLRQAGGACVVMRNR